MKIECVDAMVMLDNNKAFNAFVKCEEVERVDSAGGLSNAGSFSIFETTDRKIPNSLKDGEALITDVLVKLEPNVSINLN